MAGLLRTGALNGVAVAVRMGSALVLNKVLAVAVGPAGFALVGQFGNAVAVAAAVATGSTAQGVTALTAAHAAQPARRAAVWHTAAALSLAGSVVAALVLILARHWLAQRVLGNAAFAPVFVTLGIGLPCLSLNALLLAVLTGAKRVRLLVAASVGASLLNLALTAGAALRYGLPGALYAAGAGQALALPLTLAVARKANLPWPDLWPRRPDAAAARALAGYAAMAAAPALAGPLAQSAIRTRLIAHFGLDAAGAWDAMIRLGGAYTLFLTATLSVYYLPRVAELHDRRALRAEVARVAALVTPLTAVGAFLLWAARGRVVPLLFDPRFAAMTPLFGWQLAGDTLRLTSWVYAYVLLGRAQVGGFIAAELGFQITLVVLTAVATARFGFVGVSIAYAATYALYAAAVYALFRRSLAHA